LLHHDFWLLLLLFFFFFPLVVISWTSNSFISLVIVVLFGLDINNTQNRTPLAQTTTI
jgi:hypothetical protein